MKTEFLPVEDYGTYADAENAAPWAAAIIEVEGGWRAFESISDRDTWLNQV